MNSLIAIFHETLQILRIDRIAQPEKLVPGTGPLRGGVYFPSDHLTYSGSLPILKALAGEIIGVGRSRCNPPCRGVSTGTGISIWSHPMEQMPPADSSDRFAGVYWDHSRAPICMPQEVMTATNPHDGKLAARESLDHLCPGQRG